MQLIFDETCALNLVDVGSRVTAVAGVGADRIPTV
jgi:hypothetical protein